MFLELIILIIVNYFVDSSVATRFHGCSLSVRKVQKHTWARKGSACKTRQMLQGCEGSRRGVSETVQKLLDRLALLFLNDGWS